MKLSLNRISGTTNLLPPSSSYSTPHDSSEDSGDRRGRPYSSRKSRETNPDWTTLLQTTYNYTTASNLIKNNPISSTNWSLPYESIMSGVPKAFWGSPIRYLRWASHEKPAIFYSVLIGCMGPVLLVGVPPLRRAMGDQDPPRIPYTYPGKSSLIIELCWTRWDGTGKAANNV